MDINNNFQLINDFKRHFLKKVIVVLWLLLALSVSTAFAKETKRILIVESSSSNIYKQFSNAIQLSLSKNCHKDCSQYSIETVTVKQIVAMKKKLKPYSLIITLGSHAAKVITQDQLVLHTVLPLNQVNNNPKHFNLVLDQPIKRQILLVDQLLKGNKIIGVLSSNKTKKNHQELVNDADQLNVSVKTFYIESTANIGERLKNILMEVDAVLITPDKKIYNRISLKEILLTGYFNKVPFIGYSKAIASAGAIASIVTDKNNITDDIVKLTFQLLKGKTIKKINYPSQYKLIINQQIINSLDYPLSRKLLSNGSLEVIN